MPKRSSKKRKGKQDVNTLANLIVEEATGETPVPAEPEDSGKDPIAVELGRRGGLKGGKARAENMTKKQRSEAARKAAKARWKKKNNN